MRAATRVSRAGTPFAPQLPACWFSDKDLGNVPATTDGPYRLVAVGNRISGMGALMIENAFSEELIHRLAERYEENPKEFVQLPQPTVASAVARQAVSELRNEGLVEEEVRGVIRLTPRGYMEYKRKTTFATKRWA